jgi:hypothetical protein
MSTKFIVSHMKIVRNKMIRTQMKTVSEHSTYVGIIIISSFLLFYIHRNQYEIS